MKNLIRSAKSILIISHINPDGDTLGAMCGLYSLIEANFKKRPDMMAVSKIPAVYNFLPNVEKVRQLDTFDKSRVYDLVITVDVASLDRIAGAKIFFEKAAATINIDHHKTNDNFGGTNINNPSASSACEVILEQGFELNASAALCLYVGILTDTGSFRFNNTSPATLTWAAKLVEAGVDVSDTYRKVYESDTKEIVLFQAACVSRAFFENDIAYMVVYKKDMEKFAVGDDAMEGLTEKLRAIKSVNTAFVVKDMKSGGAKISMRTKIADSAAICGKFGGGGHKFAAGCTINSKPDTAAKKLLEVIKAG